MTKTKLKVKNISGLGYDAIALFVTRIASFVFGILSTKILSTGFSLEQYGTYSETLIVVELITSITIFGLTDAANYFYNSIKDKSVREKYINTIFFIEIILGLSGAIFLLVFSFPATLYFKNKDILLPILITSFLPLINNFVPMLNVLFISNGKATLISLQNVIASLLRLLFILIGCFLFKNVLAVFVLTVFSGVLQVVFFWVFFSKSFFELNPFKFDKNIILDIVKFSMPLAIYILLGTILRESDKIFLGYFLSSDEIAIYINNAKMLPFDVIVASIATAINPIVTRFINSKKEKQNAIPILKSFLTISFMSTFILTFGSLFLSSEMIVVLYDYEYLKGINIFLTYILVEMVKFCSLYFVFVAFRKNRELILLSLFSILFNLVLNYVLFNIFGSLGCAIATLLITAITNIYMFFRVSCMINVNFSNLLNFSHVALTISVAFFASCFMVGMKHKIEISGPFFSLILYFAIYLFICLICLLPFFKINFKIINSYKYEKK